MTGAPSVPARHSVRARYLGLPGLPWGTRLFLYLRWKLTPYGVMASRVPTDGKILDVGCGHGLLALALAAGSPAREVLGVDHDAERIRIGREAAHGVGNLRLEMGSMLAPPPEQFKGPFRGITAIDVLHYFEPAEQERILRQAHGSLEPGGVLLVREVDPDGGLAARFNRFYEKVATLTGFTRSHRKGLHFRAPAGWAGLLRGLGFEVKAEPCSHFLFADVLYVCRKA